MFSILSGHRLKLQPQTFVKNNNQPISIFQLFHNNPNTIHCPIYHFLSTDQLSSCPLIRKLAPQHNVSTAMLYNGNEFRICNLAFFPFPSDIYSKKFQFSFIWPYDLPPVSLDHPDGFWPTLDGSEHKALARSSAVYHPRRPSRSPAVDLLVCV